MLGAGNQNEYGHSSLTQRPPSIGQIIGHRIKIRKMVKAGFSVPRFGAPKPGQMAGMLAKSFNVAGAQSPKTIKIGGANTFPAAPGIDKVGGF